MNLDMARGMLLKDKLDDLGQEIDGLENLARQANQEVRTLLFELRPIILEHKGLIPALRSYHLQLQKSVDFQPKIMTNRVALVCSTCPSAQSF